MKKIDNPDDYIINAFDGVTVSTVYTGGFDCLKRTVLVWREDEELGEMCFKPFYILTLSEIRDQICGKGEDYKRQMITIFINDPLNGAILQYGNYGDEWWVVGDLDGYA